MKKLIIAASGLVLVMMTACSKTEMPVPQNSAASIKANAREIGAGQVKQQGPISMTPPKADR